MRLLSLLLLATLTAGTVPASGGAPVSGTVPGTAKRATDGSANAKGQRRGLANKAPETAAHAGKPGTPPERVPASAAATTGRAPTVPADVVNVASLGQPGRAAAAAAQPVAAAAAVEGGVGAATSASSGVKAKPEAGVRGPAASSHGAEAGTKPRRAPSVASGNATTVSNVTAGSNATESATVPAVPRERPEHVIPANFTARGRNLAGVPPKDRHHHCDGHNNCSVGACTFADCENPVSCNGGACTFYKCVRPTCPGGACKFIQCENPTCGGGACDFIESVSLEYEGGKYCRGGSCTIEGASHVGAAGDAVY